MDDNNTEDILSQALEYRHTLRQELDFDSTWEQEREATGGALASGQGGQGCGTVAGDLDVQEDTVTRVNPTLSLAPSMAAIGAAPHQHPSRFRPSERAVRAFGESFLCC
jgi:hypothetical protein